MMRPLALLALVAALALTPALAGAAERPVLRAEVTATDDVVTIGDFFENAGPRADRALFRAPDLGRTGTVPARDVMRQARAAGLANADVNGLAQVAVHRAALTVEPDAFDARIRTALEERTGIHDPDDLEINYSTDLPGAIADPAAAEPIELVRLSYSARSGRFDALFAVRRPDRDVAVSISGTARQTAEVVAFAHRMTRGDTVSARDLTTIRIPRARLRKDTVQDPDEIIGLAVRRSQSPDRSLNARNFEEPVIVERRSKVVITYKLAGLTLTVQGKAMADAVKGEMIDVLNIQSHRTIQAVVTGPGRVSVQPRTARVARLEEASQ